VTATRRQDNGAPETVEIVLDRRLAIGQTYRFTFNTGASEPQTVEYTLVEFEPCCLPSGACAELTANDCSTQGSIAGGPCEGDLDADGHDARCGDVCPTDPAKLSPGQCGCGNPDTDSDSDTIADCLDQCPGNDDRIDANTNRIPDCLESTEIPTASTWGLVILTLVLLTFAKVGFGAISRLRRTAQ
jgi:hypothetical protein